MLSLFYLASIGIVVLFVFYLYRSEKKEKPKKKHDFVVGEMVGYEDFFYVDFRDVIILENNLGVNERICLETIN